MSRKSRKSTKFRKSKKLKKAKRLAREALAHAHIQRVLALYYQALDRADVETLEREVMAEDATWKFVQRGSSDRYEAEVSGREMVIAWFRAMLGGDVSMGEGGEGEVIHSIDTTVIDVDGKRATSTSVVRAVDAAKMAIVAAGTARAELVETSDGWRIARYEIDERITDADMQALRRALGAER